MARYLRQRFSKNHQKTVKRKRRLRLSPLTSLFGGSRVQKISEEIWKFEFWGKYGSKNLTFHHLLLYFQVIVEQ